ncbi:hypothetical protein ACFFX0_02035 [Citricoccus parietis]|uniref:Uncharacterized protein n=1 Tax=Citricoccus parietis TaxID=592307 RepID=A0ABV5FTP0_9MICC
MARNSVRACSTFIGVMSSRNRMEPDSNANSWSIARSRVESPTTARGSSIRVRSFRLTPVRLPSTGMRPVSLCSELVGFLALMVSAPRPPSVRR